MDDANAAIELSLDRANRLIVGGAGDTLSLLQQAERELRERLQWVAKKHGGPSGSYTEAHAQIYRQQIGMVTRYLQQRLQGKTDDQAREAIRLAVTQTVNLATRLEERFTGITRPLALHSQAMQDEIVRGTGASRIRQNAASWDRYGQVLTRDFERVLRLGQLEGATHAQMIDGLIAKGDRVGITAQRLHEQTPGSFPEPTGYVAQRYWAERIVRTEVAHGYNAAALNTMQAAKNSDFPDMQKKILAHFDNRTAPDSIAVHGQIRPLDGYFMDGAGRTYLHPPGRPNDRETVIPWRPHWAELEATEPSTPTEQVEAQQAATGGPPKPLEHKAAQIASLMQIKRLEAKERAQARRMQVAELAQQRAKAKEAEVEQYLAMHRVAGQMDWETLAKSLNIDEAGPKKALAVRVWKALVGTPVAKGTLVEGQHAREIEIESGIGDRHRKAALNALNIDELKALGLHPLRKLALRHHILLAGAKAAGSYRQEGFGGTIQIATARKVGATYAALRPGVEVAEGKSDLDDIAMTVRHEIGHHLHSNAPRRFDTIIADAFESGTPITQYAKQNRFEYFAESYAVYRTDPKLLRRHDPAGWGMVRAVCEHYGMR